MTNAASARWSRVAGLDALLDFQMEVALDGERLSKAEIKTLLAQSEGLAFIRGKWVEVDHDRLSRTLEQFGAIERRASDEGLSFGEAMRLLAGATMTDAEAAGPAAIEWSHTAAGPWLAETLAGLRRPDGLGRVDPGPSLRATLRPYQQAGVQWLYLLAGLRLGACLADDMGLGKTIQVLSLLLVLKNEARANTKPSLLVAPASLLANWAAEIARFAASLNAIIAHPSAMPPEQLKANVADNLTDAGQSIEPVRIEGRVIAKSFWGKSWCTNLERYSNFASRLPRGRTYVRNGSVLDLQVAKGEVRAMVSGSELYTVRVTIAPATTKRWRAICKDCAGSIDSLVELLQGRLSKGVMDRVCREGDGLFPAPEEIELSCSCPDWADMCKHVAAVLYGVGARLDERPELLFG